MLDAILKISESPQLDANMSIDSALLDLDFAEILTISEDSDDIDTTIQAVEPIISDKIGPVNFLALAEVKTLTPKVESYIGETKLETPVTSSAKMTKEPTLKIDQAIQRQQFYTQPASLPHEKELDAPGLPELNDPNKELVGLYKETKPHPIKVQEDIAISKIELNDPILRKSEDLSQRKQEMLVYKRVMPDKETEPSVQPIEAKQVNYLPAEQTSDENLVEHLFHEAPKDIQIEQKFNNDRIILPVLTQTKAISEREVTSIPKLPVIEVTDSTPKLPAIEVTEFNEINSNRFRIQINEEKQRVLTEPITNIKTVESLTAKEPNIKAVSIEPKSQVIHIAANEPALKSAPHIVQNDPALKPAPHILQNEAVSHTIENETELKSAQEVVVDMPMKEQQYVYPQAVVGSFYTVAHKVGEAQLHNKVIEQFEYQVSKVVGKDNEIIKFTLNPQSLGEVEIQFKIEESGGHTNVSVLAERYSTLSLLGEIAQQIEASLIDSGFKSNNFTLNLGMQNDSRGHNNFVQPESMANFDKPEVIIWHDNYGTNLDTINILV